MTTLTYIVAVATVLAPTIVRRADRTDDRYVKRGAQFHAVARVGRLGDGTLVAPQWVLTAGHVADAVAKGGRARTVLVAGREFAIDGAVVHPLWRELGEHDIGLVHLASPVTGVRPMGLFRGKSERGMTATLVGHGASGTGEHRTRTEDGLARGATSKIDSTSAAWLYFSFDAPPGGTELEGAPGAGDSGGPALVFVGGRTMIAGVSSAGFDGRDGPGSYGAVDVFTRVSTHARWIDSTMKTPRPSPHATPASSRATPGTVAQGAILPNTALGNRYKAFLKAMDAGTDSAIVSFLEAHYDAAELAQRSAQDRLPNFRRLASLLQRAELLRVVEADETHVVARLKTPATEVTIELIGSASSDHRIVDWRRFD